ncbi:MAG: hypothetical protein U1E40_04030 [Amaricoccus sp.]
MAPRRTRAKAVDVGFMLAWMVFWAAGMVVVVWNLGASALQGEAMPALFMAAWLVAAGAGLVSAGRRLLALLSGPAPGPRRSTREHAWDDGIPPPPPAGDGGGANRP